MADPNQPNEVPPVPKSICGVVGKIVKDFLTSDHTINYARVEAFAFQQSNDLLPLRTHIKQHFTTVYNAAYAKDAAALLKLAKVNAFLKTDHRKCRRTPEAIETEKADIRMKNQAGRRRKAREDLKKLEDQAATAARVAAFVAPCEQAECCLKLTLEWQNLLFTETGAIIGATDSPDGAIVLCDEDEAKLALLYADIKAVFSALRGAGCEECDRALIVIQKLEQSWYLVRSHPSLLHLLMGTTNHLTQRLPSAPFALPPKKKSGGQKRSTRAKSGQSLSLRVGGLARFSWNHSQKLLRLDNSIKECSKDLKGRALNEDDACLGSNKKMNRKSFRKTAVQAKHESSCPTKHQEMSPNELNGFTK